MSTIQIKKVHFQSYSDDHPPPHVHARANGIRVIINLLADRNVALATRRDAVRPADAPNNEVRRIRRIAAANYTQLLAVWESTHGKVF